MSDIILISNWGLSFCFKHALMHIAYCKMIRTSSEELPTHHNIKDKMHIKQQRAYTQYLEFQRSSDYSHYF